MTYACEAMVWCGRLEEIVSLCFCVMLVLLCSVIFVCVCGCECWFDISTEMNIDITTPASADQRTLMCAATEVAEK